MYKSGSLRAPFIVGLNDKMNMKNGEIEEPRKGRRFQEKVDGAGEELVGQGMGLQERNQVLERWQGTSASCRTLPT